jgi:predicted DCC family thiol-disulfide oxidoreductase YuxK
MTKHSTQASPQAITAYYNSACPVCDAGVRFQKKKMNQTNTVWRDVHCDITARSDLQSDLEFVRKRLHVVDKHGRLHIGMDAFIALWSESSEEEWKARVSADNSFAWLLYRMNILLNRW